MRGSDLVIVAVRTNRVAKDRLAFLVGAVVRVPMVVHHPGIDGRRRFDRGKIRFWIWLGTGQVRSQAADLDEWSFNRGPRHAELIVRDVNPALDGKPVLAGAGKLVLFWLDHASRNVDAQNGVGNVEPETDMNALDRANGLFINSVGDFDAA